MRHLHALLTAAATTAAILATPAGAATVVTAGTPGTNGATALYLNQLSEISTSDTTATTAELQSFLGAPDDDYTGLGGATITYDLGDYRVVNGAGFDLNVYEVDGGNVEFGAVNVLISADGTTFYNINTDFGAAVNLAGDELHGNAAFRRGYDLANAAAALGTDSFRYLRLQGLGSGPITGSSAFDPDAVGFVNFTAPTVPGIPEPATWAMLIGGIGVTGGALRRRKASVAFA